NGGIRYQALNNELAAKFYLTGGDNRIGTLYLQEARKHYHRWGAVEKATFLEEKYPSFPGRSEKSAPESDDFTSRTSSEAVKCQMLDLSTIIKASQAISKEIDLEELLKKIMRIVIENTGAQKGYLLLRDHQRWTIAVEGILAGSTYRTVPAQPVENSGLLSTSVFHFVTHMRQSVVLNDAAADDTYAHDTYIKRQQPRSLLCAPLLSYGELIGVWYLENNLNTGVFTGERTGILDLLSAQVAISLENARMYRKLDELNKNLEQTVAERTRELVQLKNARMKAELKAAQEAQLSIMPDADPQVPGYDISGICIPTTEVGGDFFDYLWLDEEKTQMGIVIGDVSGKSMKAAMTAILSCGIISADADGAGSLTEIMNRVNRHLYAKTERKMFTALCLPALDTKRKQMTFINAGLNDVFLLRKGEGTFIRGEGARVPLGIMKQNDYREKVVPLETDDVLVFFTDGITESHNEDGEFYGTQSLAALLTTPDTKKLTASQIKETIIKDVQAFVAGSRQNDDITLVVVKVTA
ncbi:MAG: SpoIIE family protein phosphatase, partial [bacterium]|nr:SpoIIE family protein phosphatase [bacterium]